MINFELDEEQQLIRDTVVSFARTRFVPTHARPTSRSHSGVTVQKGWSSGSSRASSRKSTEASGADTPRSRRCRRGGARVRRPRDRAPSAGATGSSVPLVEFAARSSSVECCPLLWDVFEPGAAAVMEPRMAFDAAAPLTPDPDGDDTCLGREVLRAAGRRFASLPRAGQPRNGDGASRVRCWSNATRRD